MYKYRLYEKGSEKRRIGNRNLSVLKLLKIGGGSELEAKYFLDVGEIEFPPFQKEKCNRPFWPFAWKICHIPQFISGIQSILNNVAAHI
ncbi:UNVERIFIED_CONTAM: hypothetical protein NCL1_20666 [Trichonephila clavipes]